ncbi:thioredoxin domain-containing protein [Asaia krungthepensis]|uniref:Methylamine utilization protein MauD n=1 Tax=Asaia krungthepensis NRIC 0535 TaxID=1307925 RepID=A0ABQ0PVE8_9PROT|nr:methylamine dehydrogenase [Asaia krungthepensis]GBQ82588.1 methylamine utilization protein MauD [Asaia krungthepensis NRIC 0535]
MSETTTLLYMQVMIWVIVLGLCAVLVMMVRRVRGFYRRIAPLGALAPSGSAIDHLPATTLPTLAGQKVTLGGTRADGGSQLLVFVSGACPVSRKMVPIVDEFARREGLALTYCGDETKDMALPMLATLGLAASRFVNDAAIGRLLGVDRVPFAVLLDEQGRVQARGLVNNLEHLESLLGVQETGYRSLQGFMTAHPQALAG